MLIGNLTLEFSESGGYDCMTGAWIISRNGIGLVFIDQADFGQKSCDFDFRSEEAERVARTCFAALTSKPSFDWAVISKHSPFSASEWHCESEQKAREFVAKVEGRIVLRRTSAVDAGKWQYEETPGHWVDMVFEVPF